MHPSTLGTKRLTQISGDCSLEFEDTEGPALEALPALCLKGLWHLENLPPAALKWLTKLMDLKLHLYEDTQILLGAEGNFLGARLPNTDVSILLAKWDLYTAR